MLVTLTLTLFPTISLRLVEIHMSLTILRTGPTK